MSSLQASKDRFESQVTLRDGTLLTLRELRTEDSLLLERFADSLSEETIHFRFLGSSMDIQVLLKELAPRPDSFTLVAVWGGGLVGHAAYYRSGLETAEVGLLVSDAFQGRGLGTAMVEGIARAANEAGISLFETIIGWENLRMIKMVRAMGFPTSEKVESEVVRIRFPTSIDPVTIKEFQDRWVFGPN
jgi:GNAT superfamily N-acetyltransferase